MISDFRNQGAGLNLLSLRDTDSLRERLEKGPLVGRYFVETKLDGERATLQMGPSGCFLISRSRHGETKGVDSSKSEKFVDKGAFEWMERLSATLPDDVLLDGELVAIGDSRTATDVARKATEKKFVAFDILRHSAAWLMGVPLEKRREMLVRWRATLSDNADRMEVVDHRVCPGFTLEFLELTLDEIRASTTGLEGYVLKSVDEAYVGGTFGWKIKPKDNEDGVVIGFNREKLHHLGAVTTTERVGSVRIAQYRQDSSGALLAVTVAYVGIPEADRCPMGEFMDKLAGRVVEFKHRGWDGKSRFRFPLFVRWRTDKPLCDCILKVRSEVAS